MKIFSSVIVLLLLSGCVHDSSAASATQTERIEKVRQQALQKSQRRENRWIIKQNKVIVVRGYEVNLCTLPKQPRPLDRPLPLDSPKNLIDRLTIKLEEWVIYGDRVEKSCKHR